MIATGFLSFLRTSTKAARVLVWAGKGVQSLRAERWQQPTLYRVSEVGQRGSIDVVFLHGIGGHAAWTWQSDPDTATSFWPGWLAEDHQEARIISVQYPSALTALEAVSTPDLTDISRQLFDQLRIYGVGSRPVVFICHSMGGLLCKLVLLHSEASAKRRSLWKNTTGVVFLATPHTGSLLARYVKETVDRVSGVASAQLRQLSYDDKNLMQLSEAFQTATLERSEEEIRFAVFFETAPTFPLNSRVVEEASARGQWAGSAKQAASNVDHLQIAKLPSYEGRHENIVYDEVSALISNAVSRGGASEELTSHEKMRDIAESIPGDVGPVPAGRAIRKYLTAFLGAIALLLLAAGIFKYSPFEFKKESPPPTTISPPLPAKPQGEMEPADQNDTDTPGELGLEQGWQLLDEADWDERYGHAAVVFDGMLWIAGGHDGTNSPGSYLSDVWRSNDAMRWTRVTEQAPWAARKSHTLVAHDGKLWLLGGLNVTVGQGYQGYSDVWSSADGVEWDQVTSSAPWGPRWDHTSMVHNGEIWIIGGASLQEPGSWVGGHNDVWHSADGQSWSKSEEPPFKARWAHASTVHSGLIWVAGGYDGSEHLADVWFSGDGNRWREASKESAWEGRANHTLTALNRRLWLVGGTHGNFSAETLLSTGQVWSSNDGRTWKRDELVAEHWKHRANHAAVAFRGALIVLGGQPRYSGPPSRDRRPYNNEIWAYRPRDGQ